MAHCGSSSRSSRATSPKVTPDLVDQAEEMLQQGKEGIHAAQKTGLRLQVVEMIARRLPEEFTA